MRGADISARPSASICCSPPLRLPASCRRRSRSTREGLVSRIRGWRRSPRARRAEGAEQQVLLDRQFREQPPAFGHQADAEIDDLLGRAADEIVRVAVDLGDDAARRSAAACP